MAKQVKNTDSKQLYIIIAAIAIFTTIFYTFKLYPYTQLVNNMQLVTIAAIFVCSLGVIKLKHQKNSIETSWNSRALAGTGRDLLAMMVILILILTMHPDIKAVYQITLLLGFGVSDFMVRLTIISKKEG